MNNRCLACGDELKLPLVAISHTISPGANLCPDCGQRESVDPAWASGVQTGLRRAAVLDYLAGSSGAAVALADEIDRLRASIRQVLAKNIGRSVGDITDDEIDMFVASAILIDTLLSKGRINDPD